MPGLVELRWINLQERWLGRLDAWSQRLYPARTAPHLATGIRGERAALFALRRRGYTVVAARWTSPRARGDVDLVAWDGRVLCFLEVKTRTARDRTPAEAAVDDDKRRTLRTLARLYLAGFPAGEREAIAVRFDVVSVYLLGPQIEVDVLPGAFGMR
jgi:putative endonuclease